MTTEILKNEANERMLYLSNGKIRIGLALDYGIRIGYLACEGMQNLFYEQPLDGSDGFVTPEGWRLRGGHRMWPTPETHLVYCPDNDPVEYEIKDNTVTVTQKPEPWLNIQKIIRLTLEEDGSVLLEHAIKNVGTQPQTHASWGVNTLAGGGTAETFYGGGIKSDMQPGRVLSFWGDTSLADPRLTITKDQIIAKHMPLPDYFKLGMYCSAGKAILHNRGQRLEITFDAPSMDVLPDGGCNFELYMCSRFMELETLGAVKTIAPGESVCHWERWNLTPETE